MTRIGRPMANAVIKGKSMFGTQELSRRRTAPSHGFGSSTRNHASKVFMGPEHAKTSSISCTPGPCYEVTGACGSQYDSGKTSPPQWCFGTAERFAGSSRNRSPGPGAYENAGGFGKQDLSHRSSFPLYGFGTVDRSMASKVCAKPCSMPPPPTVAFLSLWHTCLLSPLLLTQALLLPPFLCDGVAPPPPSTRCTYHPRTPPRPTARVLLAQLQCTAKPEA